MRVIFIEYDWQVEEILKNKEKFIDDVIISLHHETSYLLMRNNIRYFETFEFCKHDELWKKYIDLTTTLHQVLVAAMKCKQTVDDSNVDFGVQLVDTFVGYYFDSHGLDHLKKLSE